MKLKKIIFTVIISFCIILNVNALNKENLKGSPISKFEKSIFSYNRIEIDNLSVNNNEHIGGSSLQIQDTEGNTLIEWKNTDETYVIEGLEEGIYYLVQIEAPEGYELNPNRIKFEVGDEMVKLEIKNAKNISVPGTMSSNNTLLAFVAMLNIALGIGILTYVKKNKA